MERLLTPDGIEEELSKYDLRFEDERSRRLMAEDISANAPKLFAVLIYLRKGHTIYNFLQEGIGDCHLPFERHDKTTKTGDFKLCRQHRPKEPIHCMLDWDRDDIIHFERDQWCTTAPIFSYTKGVEHYEFEQNLVLPFITDHEHSDHVKNAGFSRVWKVVIHHAHQRLFENAFAEVRALTLAISLTSIPQKTQIVLAMSRAASAVAPFERPTPVQTRGFYRSRSMPLEAPRT